MRNQLAREKAKQCLLEDPASEGKQDKVDANLFEVRELGQQIALQWRNAASSEQSGPVPAHIRESETFEWTKNAIQQETYGGARIGHVLPGDALGQPPIGVGHVGNRVVEKGHCCRRF